MVGRDLFAFRLGARSLTGYTAAGGFAARSQASEAYDADYSYDANGNLTPCNAGMNMDLVDDKGEGIDAIRWTPYGKVKEVNKASGERISFRYDAAGHRVEKQVLDTAG